jgi:hypothetical protein
LFVIIIQENVLFLIVVFSGHLVSFLFLVNDFMY